MATGAQEAELKQQGALEASRDPNSLVSAEDAERKALEESKRAGVEAYSFDPDATAEQKAAQAKSVRTRLPPQARIARNWLTGFCVACAGGLPSPAHGEGIC